MRYKPGHIDNNAKINQPLTGFPSRYFAVKLILMIIIITHHRIMPEKIYLANT